MSYRQQVLDYLRAVAPASATNRDLAGQLEGVSYASVYRASRALVAEGLVQATKEGREWHFDACPAVEVIGADVQPFEPVTGFSWDTNLSAASWQVRWLVPVLSCPEGRLWFLEKLRCPVSRDEAERISVYHFCRPLGDLFISDFRQCQGSKAAEDGLVEYYNNVFGLPRGSGMGKVWRSSRKGRLRLPIAPSGGAWTNKLLRRQLKDKRVLQQALTVKRMLECQVEVMLVTDRHVVLVPCLRQAELEEAALGELRRMAGCLEQRLDRMFYLGVVVDWPQQLGTTNVAHLRWSDLMVWLDGVRR